MTTCVSSKHDAALLEGCVCSVELVIFFIPRGYRTVLKRDGVVMERKNFATQEQVLSWANAIVDLVGQNLYVKLSSNGEDSQQATLLELASVLSRLGCLIGSNSLRLICRLPAEHLE